MLEMNGPTQIDESSILKWTSQIIVIIIFYYYYSRSSLLDTALPGSSLLPVSPETEQNIVTRVDGSTSV
jgi:hypothetical protein